jgi:hypothetical protein
MRLLKSFLDAGVYEIPKDKHQITNKSQIPIPNDRNMFGILKLGTRPQGGESKRSADNFGHCDLFGICNLLFELFSHSNTRGISPFRIGGFSGRQ